MRKLEQLLMATIGAGLTLACATHQPKPAGTDDVAMLVKRSKESNTALMRGDIEAYKSLLTLAQDFTLFSPFGGDPTRGALNNEAMQRMGRFFKHGTHEQEVVQTYGTQDMVVLAVIERARVEVGGLPSQDWALRVTLVYRREGDDWTLVHRHADPLVDRISLPHAATLARGERSEGG
jgi:ketosteroid isomerase-like protein